MKSLPLHWRPAALQDLDALAVYCADEGGVVLGLKFIAAMEATAALIAAYPDSGSRRRAFLFPDLPASLRLHPLQRFERVLVYYLALPRYVEIVRIWDASCGLEALLEDTSDECPRVSERRVSGPATREGMMRRGARNNATRGRCRITINSTAIP